VDINSPLYIFSGLPFDVKAIELMHYQYKHNQLYRSFVDILNIDLSVIAKAADIPCIPISFFKTNVIYAGNDEPAEVFTSTGTTGDVSKHFVKDLNLYEESFQRCFNIFFGDVNDYCILALLPSYLERKGSSLIYMCERLIEKSANSSSGFYLNNRKALFEVLQAQKDARQKTMLIGVTFALLDFADEYKIDIPELTVVETGGMKGRRKELLREEVHALLKPAFNVTDIYSEYGMTELLSQAWSKGDGIFDCPPWMNIYIRDINNPFDIKAEGSGGINIIDLANIYSCPFIATQDLGKKLNDKEFEVLGRFDNSDLRGCNLMID
jgi:phenylacetate-coenzyme A ligase PaaK-like adenylate-forming protein